MADMSPPEYHHGMKKPYCVRANWDADASVWVATSNDVPCVITEAATVEALISNSRVWCRSCWWQMAACLPIAKSPSSCSLGGLASSRKRMLLRHGVKATVAKSSLTYR